MSIYKLKLGFLRLFNCLWTLQGSMGWPTSWTFKNEVLKLRKSNCVVGPT